MSIHLYSQNKKNIEIINADNTFADTYAHPDYWRLIGNVAFKHNNAIMTCDSAYHYTSKNKIQAFGNIQINQGDSIIMRGNYLTYFGSENKANIKENVILIDKQMTLNTEQVIYNLITNIASYPNKGTITDNEKKIHSKRGAYHSSLHKFIFKDSVKIIGKDYKILTDNMHYNSNYGIADFFGPSFIYYNKKTIYCENGWYNTKTDIAQFRENAWITTKKHLLKGDSLYYNKNQQYGKAFSNVRLIDTVENITIIGGVAEYFEDKSKIVISKKPVLEMLHENDTLFMHANVFISKQTPKQEEILAYNKVKIFKSDFQGSCDSLSYKLSDSTIEMYHSPVLWLDEFQITSDSLKFLIFNGEIHHALLKPKPMIISQEDSLDYNQIKGKNMIAYFRKNKIKHIDIIGNGQSIFIIRDEQSQQKTGLNYTESTNLTLYFTENKLKEVVYDIQPKSTTIPYKDIKEENRYLKGFLWREDQPKSKMDIFN